ncbi:hypothetical protein ACRAKJ_19480 [Saccharothrix sp. DSM 118769]
MDDWAQEFGEQLLVEASAGRNRHAVAFDMRARVQEFTQATRRALVDIRGRTLTHDGDRRLRRHALNPRRALDRYGTSVAEEGRDRRTRSTCWCA